MYPSPLPPLHQFFDQTSKMIKAKRPHPGESIDTTDKELLLVVDCPNEDSHLGTHLGDATTIEKFKVCTIEEINKMIVDGPASDFHKVKLEGTAGGHIFNAIFATVLRFWSFRLFFAFSTPFSISSLTSILQASPRSRT